MNIVAYKKAKMPKVDQIAIRPIVLGSSAIYANVRRARVSVKSTTQSGDCVINGSLSLYRAGDYVTIDIIDSIDVSIDHVLYLLTQGWSVVCGDHVDVSGEFYSWKANADHIVAGYTYAGIAGATVFINDYDGSSSYNGFPVFLSLEPEIQVIRSVAIKRLYEHSMNCDPTYNASGVKTIINTNTYSSQDISIVDKFNVANERESQKIAITDFPTVIVREATLCHHLQTLSNKAIKIVTVIEVDGDQSSRSVTIYGQVLCHAQVVYQQQMGPGVLEVLIEKYNELI